MTTHNLSQKILRFAERECRDSSPLYESLAIHISMDDELLEICKVARGGQPIPNLLFGAVHYLLMQGTDHPVKEYYPSMVSDPKPYPESFESFKPFCLTYRNEIESIISSKLVQTNEVRRCTYLYPAFGLVHQKTNKPLALIEIGTSGAGLQLLWDQYAYSYGTEDVIGDVQSQLNIRSELVGELMPPLSQTPAPVASRIGLDLNIVDLENEDERLWLKSLIWPEHGERLEMFERASSYIGEQAIDFIEGDRISRLSGLVENIPEGSTLCIFHTHVANQMTIDMKKHLLNVVEQIGQTRDVFHLYNNIQDKDLHLDEYENGVKREQTIAETDGHGRWFKWLLENEPLLT
ncbi:MULTISPECIES: DUF2332 domain-containing protein [unclassified Exiguobacterium]|uniref:DUF2332 domain-containing protein n=1 Tax=unclassified Exiguobacterium TaxID=2644629 RepID=UPI001BEC91A4|nr:MULTISPECIES: DUF2332 domain-containing protein [unclassified Exiguobacterium]